MTTLVNSRGPAHGITRLIGKVLEELIDRTQGLVLCKYDQGSRRFRALKISPRGFLSKQRASSQDQLELLSPEMPLTPFYDRARNLFSRLYFALPSENRIASRKLMQLGRHVRIDLANLLTYRRSVYRLGAEIGHNSDDVLVQCGALWNSHGAAEELERLEKNDVRIISLVYDLIPILRPEFFDEKMARRFLAWGLATLGASRHIVAISKTTRGDLETVARRYGVPCPATSVLRLGDDTLLSAPDVVDKRLVALAQRPFVLCLGTMEVRKNHRLLYQVWRRLADDPAPPRLVIVGKRGWLTEEVEALFLRDRSLRDHVVIVRGAGDDAAAWLLARALFTVYPSFYEGWGLPVAESLCAGRIVVASDAASVQEAGQGLAIHLPCDDVLKWTHTIRALCADVAERRRVEAKIAAEMVRQTWVQAASDLTDMVVRFAKGEENLTTPPL